MKRTFFRYDLATALLAAILCSAMAQEPPPQGATILDKYIEATGGRAAYEKLRTEVRTGSMELVGKGITASMTLYRAAPSKSYMVMEMPGVGKMEEGTDGVVVWSRSAIQAPESKRGTRKPWAFWVRPLTATCAGGSSTTTSRWQGSRRLADSPATRSP